MEFQGRTLAQKVPKQSMSAVRGTKTFPARRCVEGGRKQALSFCGVRGNDVNFQRPTRQKAAGGLELRELFAKSLETALPISREV